MRSVICGLACAFSLSLGAAAAHAVVLGATDTFEDGSVNGWTGGANNPSPPTNVATGGPAGAGDNYLLAASSGNPGPGGRLVVIGGPQWNGDYTAAGVSAITMNLNNLGAGDLSLRLVLFSGNDTAISTNAVMVPAGSGWVQASFSLAPAVLTGSPLSSVPGTLATVSDLRLFHGSQAAFPGNFAAAQLGIDNVAAVPEPASTVLLAAGLLALAGRTRWRKRQQQLLPAPFG
jgi:hypothetical protein